MESIHSLWAQLHATGNASYFVITALVFVTVYGSRKVAPEMWELLDRMSPDGKLKHLIQALPAALLGIVYDSALSGSNPAEPFKAALFAVGAAAVHLVGKAAPGPYRGESKSKAPKPPAGPGAVAIVLLALTGCAGLPSAKTVDTIAEDACRLAFGAERERAGLSLADVVNMADEFCGLQKNMAPFRRAILGASREQSGAMRVEMGAE